LYWKLKTNDLPFLFNLITFIRTIYYFNTFLGEKLIIWQFNFFQEIISHWHPNITINIVNDYTNWIPGQVSLGLKFKKLKKLNAFLVFQIEAVFQKTDMKPYFNIMIEMTYENVKIDNLKTT
jgi:hypothetical protein